MTLLDDGDLDLLLDDDVDFDRRLLLLRLRPILRRRDEPMIVGLLLPPGDAQGEE